MGLPSIVLVFAENQSKAAKDLAAAGVCINLGDAEQVTIKELVLRIKGLIGNEKLRSELSRRSLKLMSYSQKNNLVERMIADND